MKKPTKEKRKMNNRKGSYLVEATLTLPVMILASLAIAMIINIIAACETIGFAASCQLKKHLLSESSNWNTVSLCRSLEAEVAEQCPQLENFQIKSVRTGYRSNGVTDLIGLTTETSFHVFYTSGIGGGVTFEQKLMARAFTGSLQDSSPLDAADFMQGGTSYDVVIYPKYGERFHKTACGIVQQQKEDGNSGWSMDLEEAKRQGFTPCQICGGGIS